MEELKLPAAPPLEKVTVPVGLVGLVGSVSVTVAVQELEEPACTDPGSHATTVLVE